MEQADRAVPRAWQSSRRRSSSGVLPARLCLALKNVRYVWICRFCGSLHVFDFTTHGLARPADRQNSTSAGKSPCRSRTGHKSPASHGSDFQKLQDAGTVLCSSRPQCIRDDMLGPEQPGLNLATFKADRDLQSRRKRLGVQMVRDRKKLHWPALDQNSFLVELRISQSSQIVDDRRQTSAGRICPDASTSSNETRMSRSSVALTST